MTAHGKRPDELGADFGAPARLVDDPATSALVRQDLANVASTAPSYDAAAGLVALHAVLGAGAKVAAGATSSAGTATAVKGAFGLKLIIAGTVGAIAIASAVVVTQVPRSDPPAEPRRAPAAQPKHHQPAAPVLAPAIPAAPLPQEPGAVPAQPEPVARPDHVTSLVSPGQRDRAAAEVALLAQIKAEIERAPARALRLAEQGQRRFGDGYLHHEREGLAIVALHALGRRDQAAARARVYLARYPHSSMSERVRALEKAVAP